MTKKNLAHILVVILTVTLVGLLIGGIYISYKISKSTSDGFLLESKEKIEYHIMVIVDASSQAYGESFIKGLNQGAESKKTAVEIIKVDGTNYEEDVLEKLDVAMYAEVDGVILHAINNEGLIDKINELSNRGIPVITLNNDLVDSDRIAYVGVNRYNIGRTAGQLMAEAMNGEGKLAIIEQKTYANIDEEIMLLGMRDVLKDYPDLTLQVVKYTERGVLSAETVATDIFREYPDISGIFCANGQNTLGVVQVLLDQNKVNNVVLMGYGNQEEILDYIAKGNIVESTIYTDYEDIGREAIDAFYEYQKVSFVSNYINTEMRIITKDNVEDYRKELREINEESTEN